jgi:hypothetical protein
MNGYDEGHRRTSDSRLGNCHGQQYHPGPHLGSEIPGGIAECRQAHMGATDGTA